VFNGTSGAGGEQRSKQEKVSRGHNNNIVLGGINLLEQRDRAPTGTKNNEGLLGGIGHRLISGVSSVINGVGSQGSGSNQRAISNSPKSLQEGESLLGLLLLLLLLLLLRGRGLVQEKSRGGERSSEGDISRRDSDLGRDPAVHSQKRLCGSHCWRLENSYVDLHDLKRKKRREKKREEEEFFFFSKFISRKKNSIN